MKFEICPVDQESPCFSVDQALTVDDLNVSHRYCPGQLDVSEWPHLKNVPMPSVDVDVSRVSILIGQDVPQAHVVFNYCWGDDPQKQPYGMKTPFGWCVAGPTGTKEDTNRPIALSIFNFDWARDQSDMALHKQVEQFWATEKHGFGNADESTLSIEDKEALQTLERTTKLVGGRYEVGLLWKNEKPHLPDNRVQAERRLQQLNRRFQRDPEFAEQYKMVMDEYIRKGYARRLSFEEAAQKTDITWYLPHHGVTNPNKSKVRVVYDAAATYGGTCLNKELLQGPQMNNTLIGVLMRFRKDKVAVASDIESMFHRVAYREADTDALRFLWWSGDTNEPPSDHKMTVHLFGKTDSPCIAAWALQRTATDNRSEFKEKTLRIVSKNFYVDDCLYSKPTPDLLFT